MKLYHKNLRKKQIVEELANRTGMSKKLCTVLYSALVDTIHSNLVNHNKVTIDGLGSFCIKKTKEIMRRLPSGALVYKDERAKPTFTFQQSFITHIRKTPLLKEDCYENFQAKETLDRYT